MASFDSATAPGAYGSRERWLLILGLPVLGLFGPAAGLPASNSGLDTVHASPLLQGGECQSLCSLVGLGYEASPALLLAGEVATVSIAPRFVCRGIIKRMNLVLAVSQSADLDRHEMREIVDAMDLLLSELDLPNNPNTRIAIVDAPGEARTLGLVQK